jgi:hypothetical protein
VRFSCQPSTACRFNLSADCRSIQVFAPSPSPSLQGKSLLSVGYGRCYPGKVVC